LVADHFVARNRAFDQQSETAASTIAAIYKAGWQMALLLWGNRPIHQAFSLWAIYENETKRDRGDTMMLARLAWMDPTLRARVAFINAVRFILKSWDLGWATLPASGSAAATTLVNRLPSLLTSSNWWLRRSRHISGVSAYEKDRSLDGGILDIGGIQAPSLRLGPRAYFASAIRSALSKLVLSTTNGWIETFCRGFLFRILSTNGPMLFVLNFSEALRPI
jgi:hypothetical protein